MKKSKKMTATSLALVIALLLSGCGENAEEPNDITQNSRTAAPQITVNTDEKEEASAGEDISAEADTEETEQTEEEDLPPDESLFEYYDLLNEEFEKYGITSPTYYSGSFGLGYGKYNFSSKEKTIVIPKYVFKLGDILLMYNIENKTKNAVYEPEGSHKTVCNDIMYYYDDVWWQGKIYQRKYDGTPIPIGDEQYLDYVHFNGNELWDKINYISFVNNSGDFISQSDGTLFFCCVMRLKDEDSDSLQYFMISPDGETLTQLPKPTIEVEHGFIETRDYKILACYNNKLFVNADDIGFCCLDTDNLTWEKLDFDLSKNNSTHQIKSIGKYILLYDTIYDMETKQVLVHNENFPVGFASSYYGGKHNVAKINGKWYFLRCASDGSEVDLKYFESYDVEEKSLLSATVTPITDKYYIYEDNYGYFLRSYEKGAEEETMWLKDEIENLTPDEINDFT